MRPLKRPMFRNGGPIKEGIMHGMQNGGLANNEGPRRAALVGNPIYPQGPDGRTGHFIPAVIGGIMAAARAVPAVYRGFRSVKTLPGTTGFVQKAKSFFTPSNPAFRSTKPIVTRSSKPTVKADGDYGAINIAPGKPLGFFQALKDPKRVGQFIRQNPLTALSIPTLPNLAFGAVKAAGPVAFEGAKRYIDAVLPGEQFKGDDKIKETEKTDLQRTDKITNVGEVNTDTTKSGASKNLSDAEKAKLEEDRISSTKEKYYKLMGVDKLNKQATYDTLIGASQRIREGGNIKDQIKSGSLVSGVIESLSKNLDKSVDLKKQIDAAILKGEIEKDINLTKPSAFQEQLAYIRANPNDALAKKLSGVTSAADIVAASVASGKGTTLTSDNIASIVESKGTNTDGVIPDDKYQKWEKANAGKDEIDFFIEKYSGLDDGIYVVNKKLFQKQGNQIAPISLDSIVG